MSQKYSIAYKNVRLHLPEIWMESFTQYGEYSLRYLIAEETRSPHLAGIFCYRELSEADKNRFSTDALAKNGIGIPATILVIGIGEEVPFWPKMPELVNYQSIIPVRILLPTNYLSLGSTWDL